jgi:spore maturation protein CgeB
MEILILNDADEYGLGSSYYHAFRELGHMVSLVDPFAELRKRLLWRNPLSRRMFERQIIGAFNKKLIAQLAETQADIIWVGKGAWAVPSLWLELKRRRPDLVLVCYNGDNPIVNYSRGGNRPWVTESISCFDFYCSYNESLLVDLQQAGAKRAVYIPFGWDPKVHPPLEPAGDDRQRYCCDAIFIGNGDPHRVKWMQEIMHVAKPYNWKFSIYGHWNNSRDVKLAKIIRGGPLFGGEMVKAVRSAKVSINILRVQNLGSHNMRTFEIPGCCGVMASQASPGQETFFPDGKAAIYFKDAAECVKKMREVIEDEAYRDLLAVEAHRIAQQNTYRHRAEALLATINNEG